MWWNQAEIDYKVAKYLNNACNSEYAAVIIYHLSQSAEKYVKSLLVHAGCSEDTKQFKSQNLKVLQKELLRCTGLNIGISFEAINAFKEADINTQFPVYENLLSHKYFEGEVERYFDFQQHVRQCCIERLKEYESF